MKNKYLKVLLKEIDSDLVLAGEPEKVYTGQFTDEEKRMIDMAADKIVESLQTAAHNISERIEEKYPHLKPTSLVEERPVIVELMKIVLEKLNSAAKSSKPMSDEELESMKKGFPELFRRKV